jgi:type III secretion translocon protein HrpF
MDMRFEIRPAHWQVLDGLLHQRLPEGWFAPAHVPRTCDQEVIAILARHPGRFDDTLPDELERMAADPATPPDLARALDELLVNAGLQRLLLPEGVLRAGAIRRLQKNYPGQRRYAQAQARQYVQNYIASDAADPDAMPRPMTANDARRELFMHAEELPKRMSLDVLREMACGCAGTRRCPPQLQAAAQYYVDRCGQWEQDFGRPPDQPLRRLAWLRRCRRAIQLTRQEHGALQAISVHRALFFGGGALTPARLQKIADDPLGTALARRAARELLANRVLLALLDRGGAAPYRGFFHGAGDAKIHPRDLDDVLGSCAQAGPARRGEITSWRTYQPQAARDMLEGQYNRAERRAGIGGGLAGIGASLLRGLGLAIERAFVAGGRAQKPRDWPECEGSDLSAAAALPAGSRAEAGRQVQGRVAAIAARIHGMAL